MKFSKIKVIYSHGNLNNTNFPHYLKSALNMTVAIEVQEYAATFVHNQIFSEINNKSFSFDGNFPDHTVYGFFINPYFTQMKQTNALIQTNAILI